MRTSRRHSSSMGVASIVVVLLTAIFVLGCESPEPHATMWRGMRVDAGPGFTMSDEDTVLLVRLLPSDEQTAYASVAFRWMDPVKPQDYETHRSKCVASTKYDCELDSTSMAPAECYALRDGWLADSSSTSSGICALRDRTIEARYACSNDDCQRVKLIIAQSFASLAVGKKKALKSK